MSKGDRWQVWMKLDDRAQAICGIYGMAPNDLAQHAIEVLIKGLIRDWYNIETYAVVMEIRSNPDWAEVCYMADDYSEWARLMTERGLTTTRSGVSIKDKRIARRRIDPEIRRMTRHDEEQG